MTFIDEIFEQPVALKKLINKLSNKYYNEAEKLKSILFKNSINKIIFTGMGSSLFASYIPCSYLRRKGINAFSFESNEFRYFDKNIIDENTLLVAVSQSGESKETVELCSMLTNTESLVIVTNQTNSNLYKYGNVRYQICAGNEYNTATKTYTNTIAALMYIAYIIADESDEKIKEFIASLTKNADLMQELLENNEIHINKLYDFIKDSQYIAVVGSGASYSTACHAELVLLEAGRLCASRYTVGQFTHGPIEAIDNNYKAIILDFDSLLREKVDNVIDTIVKYDGKVALITNRNIINKSENVFLFYIDCEDPFISPMLEIIPIELLVNEFGLRRNFQPGVLTRVAK